MHVVHNRLQFSLATCVLVTFCWACLTLAAPPTTASAAGTAASDALRQPVTPRDRLGIAPAPGRRIEPPTIPQDPRVAQNWQNLTTLERYVHETYPDASSQFAKYDGVIHTDTPEYRKLVSDRRTAPVIKQGYLDRMAQTVKSSTVEYVENWASSTVETLRSAPTALTKDAIKGGLKAGLQKNNAQLADITGVPGSRFSEAFNGVTDVFADHAADTVFNRVEEAGQPSSLKDRLEYMRESIDPSRPGGLSGRLQGAIGRLLDALFADIERVLAQMKQDVEEWLAKLKDASDFDAAEDIGREIDAALSEALRNVDANGKRLNDRIGARAGELRAALVRARNESQAIRERARANEMQAITGMTQALGQLATSMAAGGRTQVTDDVKTVAGSDADFAEAYPDGMAHDVFHNMGSHWAMSYGMPRDTANQLVEKGRMVTGDGYQDKNRIVRSYKPHSGMRIGTETSDVPR